MTTYSPFLAANSIHVSNEVCRNFTPVLTNLFAYLLIKSQLPVLEQMLQMADQEQYQGIYKSGTMHKKTYTLLNKSTKPSEPQYT